MKFDYKNSGTIKLFVQHYKGHLGLFSLDMACALAVSAIDLLFHHVVIDDGLLGNLQMDLLRGNVVLLQRAGQAVCQVALKALYRREIDVDPL